MDSYNILSIGLVLTLLPAAACTDSHAEEDAGVADSGTTDSSVGDSGAVDSGATDSGPPVDYYACEYAGDCITTSTTCCGVCGRPTAADVASINSDHWEDYHDDVACPEGTTEPVACPDCAVMPNPNLIAGCDSAAGMCTLIDVENSAEVAGCTVNEDCMVRVPSCCECGADTSPYNLIAVSTDGLGALLSQICSPLADCAACEPIYPPEVTAVCTAGLCQIQIP